MAFLRNPLQYILALALSITSLTASASVSNDNLSEGGHETHAVEKDQKTKVAEYIQHHLKDSHDFNLSSDEADGTHFGFPLPVILIDNGLKVFMSSKFHHGETVAEVGDSFYKLNHGVIYKTDAAGTLNFDEHHHATNEKPLDFSITKNVFSLILVAALMFFLFTRLAKTYKNGANNLPKGFGRVLEPLVIYVRDEIARPNIGEKKYKKFMPYLLSVFFLIWILNLVGLTPLGINVTGNIAITICLAMFTFIITNINGTKDYWMHILWMPGVPILLRPFLALIEILGLFTKPFSLMIRLFANITAGHTVVMGLLAVIFVMKEQLTTPGATAISLALTLFIMMIELLVAFLQAYIFTMLTSLFIGLAVEEHHHDEEHHEELNHGSVV